LPSHPSAFYYIFQTYATSQAGFETTIGSHRGLHAFHKDEQIETTIPHVTKGVLPSKGLKLIRVMKGLGESLGADIQAPAADVYFSKGGPRLYPFRGWLQPHRRKAVDVDSFMPTN